MAKSKKAFQKNEQPRKIDLIKEVMRFMEKSGRRLLNYKQVSAGIGIKDEAARILVQHILRELQNQHMLDEPERGKYRIKAIEKKLTGTVEMIQSGSAYITQTGNEHDVFVHASRLRGAVNGDKVEVRLLTFSHGRRPEGEVVKVIQRARSQFVGIVEVNAQFAFLVSEQNRFQPDIFIPLNKLNGAVHLDKVEVKVTEWPVNDKSPVGEVIRVFGKPGEHQAEMHAILAEFGLPAEFNSDVIKEAEKISDQISDAEIKKRRDFRPVTTFTIDPVDAKDFDDALSIRMISENLYEIGVHIADVSAYVSPGSILDQEAYERATSVYLVDRVVPMLPEKLSNHVCSLRPNEDKLCFSAVFEINMSGEVSAEWFGRTVINSDKRFTYEEAQEILDKKEGIFYHELNLLNTMARNIRAERFKKGSIGFDKQEVKFQLDTNGKPLGVYYKKVQDTNELIEEFMLLANKAVARFCTKPDAEKSKNKKPLSGRTMVYRIHDQPDPDKLSDFNGFISRFGYKINMGSHRSLSNSFNKLLSKINGTREENMISSLAIRTMAKAEYSTDNIGHYGLAFDYYTHFTSPIRRYPDVMVHRLLNDYLNMDDAATQKWDKNELEEACAHSSERERKAAEAERASIKYKQVEFLSDKVGQEFEGTISGVTEWGLFVELNENHCEGLVRARDLQGDTWVYDEDNYCFFGRKSRVFYQLGDKVLVKIKKCDMARKQSDFTLLGKIDSEK